MYRKRLRSTSGCLRCRASHRKCDEVRPKCVFCTKWNVECVWPKNNSRRTGSSSQRGDAFAQRDNHTACVAIALPSLDHAIDLPIREMFAEPRIARYLQASFTMMLDEALPFNVADVRSRLSRIWFESILCDEAACYSFLAYCSSIQFKRSGHIPTQQLSIACETRTLSLLRHRVQSGVPASQGSILAAVLHFVMASSESTEGLRLSTIAEGIKAMVVSSGEFATPPSIMDSSISLALPTCDCINAISNAVEPYFTPVAALRRPLSLGLMYNPSPCNETVSRCCGPDVVRTFEDIRLVTFFRAPSQQKRAFTSSESWYLVSTLHSIDYQLAILQARYLQSHSFSEVMVLALILVRFDIIAANNQHPITIGSVVSRLKNAILALGEEERHSYGVALAWICLISVVGSGLESERAWFFDLFSSILLDRYGETGRWPQTWEQNLCEELQQFMWHERIAKKYAAACLTVRDRHDREMSFGGEQTEAY